MSYVIFTSNKCANPLMNQWVGAQLFSRLGFALWPELSNTAVPADGCLADWDLRSGRNLLDPSTFEWTSLADWDLRSGRNTIFMSTEGGDSLADWSAPLIGTELLHS